MLCCPVFRPAKIKLNRQVNSLDRKHNEKFLNFQVKVQEFGIDKNNMFGFWDVSHLSYFCRCIV